MNLRLRIGLCIFSTVLLLAAIALILHKEDLDLSGDEAPFESVALPPRSVKGTMYMDGGSIWVIVVDAEGKKFDFAFPYDHHPKAGTHYGEAYHGASLSMQAGAKRLRNPLRAKEVVLSLLYHHADPSDRMTAGTHDTLAEREVPISSLLAYGRKLLK